MARKKSENITDIIEQLKSRYTPEHYEQMGIKKGKVLVFENISLKITKISKNGDVFATEIDLQDSKIVSSHYGHNVDSTGTLPFCTDCEVPVSEKANQQGKEKAELRKERTLSDGTEIEEEQSN